MSKRKWKVYCEVNKEQLLVCTCGNSGDAYLIAKLLHDRKYYGDGTWPYSVSLF